MSDGATQPNEPAPAAPGRVDVHGANPPAPLDLVDDSCPRCHAPLAHEAVMCVKCGYDLKANVVHTPEVGEVAAPAAPSAPAAPKDFVLPGRGNPQVLATCGVFIALAALIIAGVNSGKWGAWVVMGTVALTLYNIAIHTCTGVVAVIAAARLCEERFARLELTAARMFLAVSLFYAVSSLNLPLPWAFLSRLLVWAVALAAYFAIVWFLFKKDRFGAALIALAHFLLWLALQLGTGLAAMVASGQTPVPPAAGGG